MAKKRKKTTIKKKSTVVKKRVAKEKDPNFMIQVGDPKKIRKDLLESLRDVIIFMQGNETFKKIQEEKVNTISDLREDIKEINSLLNTKLRKFLPKGKLKNLIEEKHSESHDLEETKEEPTRKLSPQPRPIRPVASTSNNLTDLENQLRDIETQLRTIQ